MVPLCFVFLQRTLFWVCCTITVPLYKAYIETFIIDIVLLTSCILHICILMRGAVGSGADDGAQIDGAQMTGRSWQGAQDIECLITKSYFSVNNVAGVQFL
jgi:hypothetical protein